VSDLLPVPTIAETAKKYGFPLALRDQPATVLPRIPVNPFDHSVAVGPIFPPSNNLAQVRGTPNTRIEPTPFENLLNMLTGNGPAPATATNLIGTRG
jgi:hypothetical protein